MIHRRVEDTNDVGSRSNIRPLHVQGRAAPKDAFSEYFVSDRQSEPISNDPQTLKKWMALREYEEPTFRNLMTRGWPESDCFTAAQIFGADIKAAHEFLLSAYKKKRDQQQDDVEVVSGKKEMKTSNMIKK